MSPGSSTIVLVLHCKHCILTFMIFFNVDIRLNMDFSDLEFCPLNGYFILCATST